MAAPIEIPASRPVLLSLAFARANGVADAILFQHLREETAKMHRTMLVNGKLWLSRYSLGQILFDVPFLKSRSVISDTLDRLSENGHIIADYTGKILDYSFGPKTLDSVGFYHVVRNEEPTDWIIFDAADAVEHGIPKALILAKIRERPEETIDGVKYRKIRVADLVKELPYERNALAKHLSELVKGKILEQHPQKSKYYR